MVKMRSKQQVNLEVNIMVRANSARRGFLTYFASAGLSTTLFPGCLWSEFESSSEVEVTTSMMREAARLAGLEFDEEEYSLMELEVNKNMRFYHEIRETHLDNSVPPPLYFNPVVPGMKFERVARPLRASVTSKVSRPNELEDVAFWPVTKLAQLIKLRQVSSLELTEMYLSRLERLNPTLNCVVTLMPERARAQAEKADSEIESGNYRGLLHGIPWGAKDIIAAKGYRTTWGVGVFKDQVIDHDAAVVEKLDEAGAVLVAKLTTGELAFGHNWFGGRTNNPWNLDEGSSGSSAGSGSATAAGLVGFAIGTDTGGSILSPSATCGVVGLRPTFGRVSRYGVMAAGYSLDKIGPMCRTVEDCAVVLHSIVGPDDRDIAVVQDVPFNWDATVSPKDLRIGYFESAFEEDFPRESAEDKVNAVRTLDTLRAMGYELHPIELPRNRLTYFIEYVERSAGFDQFARERQDKELVRQNHRGELRASHLVTAVEYLQANRIRRLLMEETAEILNNIDVLVTPWRSVNPLTSMTGHPVVTVPNGFSAKGTPTAIGMVGQIYGEEKLLLVAKALQDTTDYHNAHPTL